MYEDRRKQLREILDELDRYFDEFEKSLEQTLRSGFSAEREFAFKPMVTGMSVDLGPGGRPSIRFFGNDLQSADGARAPIYEQVLDEKEGTLRLIVELPGVERDDIQVSAIETKVTLNAEKSDRRYKCEVPLEREIDPDSGRATYRNGLLDVVFSLREKTKKAYRRVSVV